MFSNFKLTASSGKHLKDISHSHIVSLKYKLITSSKNSDDLSIGFDRSRNRRKDELAENKNVKGKYHVRIMLEDVFGFAKCLEKDTYDLGYKLTLTRNKDEAVIEKVGYVLHYILSMQQQSIKSKRILNKTPTELRYIERSVFMKEVNNQNLWNFELRSQENMNVPICINIGFQQQARQDSQNLVNDSFVNYLLLVLNALSEQKNTLTQVYC